MPRLGSRQQASRAERVEGADRVLARRRPTTSRRARVEDELAAATRPAATSGPQTTSRGLREELQRAQAAVDESAKRRGRLRRSRGLRRGRRAFSASLVQRRACQNEPEADPPGLRACARSAKFRWPSTRAPKARAAPASAPRPSVRRPWTLPTDQPSAAKSSAALRDRTSHCPRVWTRTTRRPTRTMSRATSRGIRRRRSWTASTPSRSHSALQSSCSR